MTKSAVAVGWLLSAMLAGRVVASPPAPAAVRAYERGTRELEFARFAEAAAAFREAIAIDGSENASPVARPSGMNFEPYLPHLALGVAECERGELVAAAASWGLSDLQGAAAGARSAERLIARRRSCSERRGGEARAWAGARVEATRRELAARTQPDLGDRLDGLLSDAATSAPADLGYWIALGQEAERLLQEARARAVLVAPPASVAVAPSGAEERPAGDGPAAPVGPPGAAGDDPPPAGRAVTGPPAALLGAAEALFAGDPERALAALRGFRGGGARSRAQAHLLRSAASFALARLGGTESELRWRLARAERDGAREVDPALVPDRRYFSAEFVAFFERDFVPPATIELLTP